MLHRLSLGFGDGRLRGRFRLCRRRRRRQRRLDRRRITLGGWRESIGVRQRRFRCSVSERRFIMVLAAATMPPPAAAATASAPASAVGALSRLARGFMARLRVGAKRLRVVV